MSAPATVADTRNAVVSGARLLRVPLTLRTNADEAVPPSSRDVRAGERLAAGVVAPGASADLLVVDGDPLQDIGVLTDPQRRLKLVMARGRMTVNHLG